MKESKRGESKEELDLQFPTRWSSMKISQVHDLDEKVVDEMFKNLPDLKINLI